MTSLLTGPLASWWRGPVADRPAVHFHEGGEGRDVLLLINGWTASGLVWPIDWVRRLEEHYRVIRIDNRGSGWSRTAPMPCTITDLAEDAAAVLRQRRARRATVLGLSMGGMIAQELAARRPDLVERLFLVGTRPPTPAHLPMDPAELHAALRPRAAEERWPDFIRSLWSRQVGPGFAEAHPAALDEIVTQTLRRPTPQHGVLGQARAIAAWTGPDKLKRISAPTTVVHGTHDPMMPVGNGHRLARAITGASYVEVPGAGHLVPYEAPDVLLDQLLSPVTGGA